MSAPIAPTAPVAAAPVAAAPVAAPAAAPVGLPPSFGNAGGVPKIGTIASSAGGGIPDEHFDKPILFRIINVVLRGSKYEDGQVQAPVVDYLVLDPATGQFTEVRGVTIMQKNIRNELVTAHQRGLEAVTGVATLVPTSNSNAAKVLRALDDSNSGGYGAEAATSYLVDAATNTFGWWNAA